MSKKQIAGLVIVLAVAVFFGVRIIKNALTSEEAKIKKLIKELASDFEEKEFSNVFDSVAEDYSDPGKHTKKGLRELANSLIVLMRKADVSISDLRVLVSEDGKRAEVAFAAKVKVETTVGSSSDALTDAMGTNEVKFQLKKEGGKWLIYQSNLGKFKF